MLLKLCNSRFYGVPSTQQPSKWCIIDVQPDNAFKQNTNRIPCNFHRAENSIGMQKSIRTTCVFFSRARPVCRSRSAVHSCANINANGMCAMQTIQNEMWFSGFVPFPCAVATATASRDIDANQNANIYWPVQRKHNRPCFSRNLCLNLSLSTGQRIERWKWLERWWMLWTSVPNTNITTIISYVMQHI